MITPGRGYATGLGLFAGLLLGGLSQGFALAADEHAQLFDPAQAKKAGPQGKSGAPINIEALGNKLIVTSEDPEALALVSELVRALTANTARPGDFEVIRLKFANAVDTAKLLTEAFNTPKPVVSAPKGRGGFGRGAKGGGAVPSLPGDADSAERIRVVPDPATNALLVRASPLDMLTIRELVANQLDAGVTDSAQLIKTFVIGPLKNAYAVDMAALLRDIYRESMDNNARRLRQTSNPFTGATRTPVLNIDANGSPKGVTLSLAIDDKTNSLLVACPTSMYEDIKKLVDQMEFASAHTKQTVKFVRIPGADPGLIQQALDAIQGRSSASRTTSGMGGNRQLGGTGLAPGGRGNFVGGGFSSPTFAPRGGGRGYGGGNGGGRGTGGA